VKTTTSLALALAPAPRSEISMLDRGVCMFFLYYYLNGVIQVLQQQQTPHHITSQRTGSKVEVDSTRFNGCHFTQLIIWVYPLPALNLKTLNERTNER